MFTDTASMARVEATLLHFFSPSGLLTALAFIVISVMLLGGSGIEQRMHDRAVVEQPQMESPLLASHR